jgi:hypothetical protein
MTSDDLRHVLHHSPAVYFVSQQPLTRARFDDLVGVFSRAAGKSDTPATPDEHWAALQERIEGRSRWDRIVPRDTGPDDIHAGRRRRAAMHTTANILQQRPYTAFTVDDVQYVIDVFNPANELELPYARAGEPVLALLLDSKTMGLVRGGLDGIDSFFTTLRAAGDILDPEYVCGTYSMAVLAFAYLGGKLKASVRPWDFLYPLTLVPRPSQDDDTLRRLFMRVEPWPRDRRLLQVYKGLDATVLPNYALAARALNMTAIQELMP